MPSTRYAEIAPRVKDICARYDLPYNTGPFIKQLGGVQRTILRLAFPGGQPRPKPGPYRGPEADDGAAPRPRRRASRGPARTAPVPEQPDRRRACFHARGGIACRQVRRTGAIIKRTAVAFYDDQMTQHAAALTYYSLMSLFPAALLAISLLGPDRRVPGDLRRDHRLPAQGRAGRRRSCRWTARCGPRCSTRAPPSTTLVISIVARVLRHDRRARGRAARDERHLRGQRTGGSFLTRKAIDVASTRRADGRWCCSTLVLVFVGGRFADDLLGFVGIGGDGAHDLEPGPLAARRSPSRCSCSRSSTTSRRRAAPLVPLRHPGRGRRRCSSGSPRPSRSRPTSRSVADVGALYGTFAGAIVLVAWLWLTNVALLFGAELNAEIERQKELDEGVPHHETLELQARRG